MTRRTRKRMVAALWAVAFASFSAGTWLLGYQAGNQALVGTDRHPSALEPVLDRTGHEAQTGSALRAPPVAFGPKGTTPTEEVIHPLLFLGVGLVVWGSVSVKGLHPFAGVLAAPAVSFQVIGCADYCQTPHCVAA